MHVTLRKPNLFRLFKRFYKFCTRFYSFVLGNSVSAALRRLQTKHVLDFQSMSQATNITDVAYFGGTIRV